MKSSFESLAHESKITSHSLTDLQSVGTGSDKIDKRRMESHPLPSRFTIPLKDQAHSNPDLASTAAGGGSSTPRRTKTVGRDPQTNRFWFIAEDEQGLAFLRAKLAKISSESKASRPASADVESLCSKEEISESTENIGASKIFLPPPPSAALSRVDLSSKADLVGINGNLSVKTDLGDEYAAGGGGDGVESSLNSRLDMTSASNSRLDLVSTDNLYIESNSKVKKSEE